MKKLISSIKTENAKKLNTILTLYAFKRESSKKVCKYFRLLSFYLTFRMQPKLLRYNDLKC